MKSANQRFGQIKDDSARRRSSTSYSAKLSRSSASFSSSSSAYRHVALAFLTSRYPLLSVSTDGASCSSRPTARYPYSIIDSSRSGPCDERGGGPDRTAGDR